MTDKKPINEVLDEIGLEIASHHSPEYAYLQKYVNFVKSKLSPESKLDPLGTSAYGLAGEAGEYVDLLKKVKYQGKTLDKEKAKKELGDAMFYIAVGCIALDTSLKEIIDGNTEKLSARYPDGFSVKNSEVRKPDDV
jgi:NTP pyrophosphatase (non-canonical NTP hydrolase)